MRGERRGLRRPQGPAVVRRASRVHEVLVLRAPLRCAASSEQQSQAGQAHGGHLLVTAPTTAALLGGAREGEIKKKQRGPGHAHFRGLCAARPGPLQGKGAAQPIDLRVRRKKRYIFVKFGER